MIMKKRTTRMKEKWMGTATDMSNVLVLGERDLLVLLIVRRFISEGDKVTIGDDAAEDGSKYK